jgi:hypothetical protein
MRWIRLGYSCPKVRVMRSTNVFLVTSIVLGTMTTGCAGIQGFPDRTYSTADERAALTKYDLKSVLAAYDATDNAARGGMTREGYRNHVLEARIQDINLHFADFERSLYEQGIGFGVGTDWVLLALTGAASVASGGTANVLSAAATGVTGAKSAYSKDVLYEKTLPVLIAQMVAQRQTVLVRIREGETLDATAYPLTHGLGDIEAYYQAGTIPGAITNLAVNAGAQSKEAERELRDLPIRTVVAADFQDKREVVAAYVKTLSSEDVDKLATALGQSTGPTALVAILNMIADATTPLQLSVITDKIKALFNKEF